MYTSAQSRAQNPQPSKPANRWAFSMLFTRFVQKPIVNEDHTTVVVSMREHVMPLMRKYKEDMPVHVRNLLSEGAWKSALDLIKKENGQGTKRYADSSPLRADAQLIAERLTAVGFKTVSMVVHANGNMRQYNSLKHILQDCGFEVVLAWTGVEAFKNDTLIVGQSQYIQDVLEMSYHLDGPKSVPDVEGNDTVFIADFKPTLNHSEAVGVVSWKNYNGFSF